MSKKKARWRKLDNAAKLYSAASNKKDTRVFRFYCELKEEVNPDVLQEALNQTIETFPTFLMVLRKGLFWHYLEPCITVYSVLSNVAKIHSKLSAAMEFWLVCLGIVVRKQ